MHRNDDRMPANEQRNMDLKGKTWLNKDRITDILMFVLLLTAVILLALVV